MQSKICQKLTLVLCGVFLLAFAVLFVFLPKKAVSESENRTLATLPAVTADSVLDGTYGSQINVYYADHFPMRDAFVTIKSCCEIAMLKGQNDGVLYSQNQLAVRDFKAYDGKSYDTVESDRYYERLLKANCDNLIALGDAAEQNGFDFCVCIPPRTVDVAASAFSYPSDASEALMADICARLSKTKFADVYNILNVAFDKGEYVYYRTDHHWTAEGAYLAYCEIMKAYGLESEILPQDGFDYETISTAFRGTTAAKGGFGTVLADTIKVPTAKGATFTVARADGRVLDGLIDRTKIGSADEYSAYLGGDDTVVTVTSGADRPKLLMVKDSFGLSLAPYLASYFDVVLTDVSARSNVVEIATQYGANAILVVYNAENIITSADAAYLKY